MFAERDLPDDLAAVKAAYAPDCTVVTADRDFETLPPEAAEDLGLLAESLDPKSYPAEWLPDDAPAALRRYAGGDFTVGMPGDGTVVWTRQTVPPTVVAKKRVEGTPEPFRSFLFAEAFVELSLDLPEGFLPFFGERYRALDAAAPFGPVETYQLAAALYDAWVGVHTREVFAGWADDHPALHEAWREAGDRIAGRLDDLSGEVARGETAFPAAAEYACSAVKHGLDLPAPFTALDTEAYREYGAEYAVRWAETTFERLADEE